jgi:DNA polymerase-3 subunit gamma/tau
MLKTLEEPPEHVKFILATTDPQKVPVTVLSRCLQFNLKQIPAPQIATRLAQVLEREGLTFEPPALVSIARAAQGSLRDALSLLDQAIAYGGGRVEEASVRALLGTVDRAYLFGLLEALAASDGAALLRCADEMQSRSLSLEVALQELAVVLHRLALAQTIPAALPADDPEREPLQALAARFAPQDLQLYYQIAIQGRAELELAPDEYAGFTMALLRMLAFAPQGTPGSQPATGAAGMSPQGNVAAVPRAGSPAEAVLREPAPAAVSSADWPQLVARLKLGGMARMLAQHCELAGAQGDRFALRVPELHQHLLEKPYRDRLQAALEEHFGSRLKVEFTTGQASGQTPAELEDRERQTKLRSAVQAIEGDPFVRELVESFDARVVDETIRPLDRPPEAGTTQQG